MAEVGEMLAAQAEETGYSRKAVLVGVEEGKVGASVGSVWALYDNALAETMNGLYKVEDIEHQRPWRGKKDLEMATLDWVQLDNDRHLRGPLGHVSTTTGESSSTTLSSRPRTS